MEEQLWKAFVGKAGRKPPDTPTDALQALTHAGVAKKEIAAALGVTVRTVERWTTTTGEQKINVARSKHAGQLTELASQHPKVRATSVSPRRTSRMANVGARLKINGQQGPSIGGKDYKRSREIERHIDGDTMAAIRDAWAAGDDDTAEGILRDALEDEGYPAWEWDDSALVEFLGERRS